MRLLHGKANAFHRHLTGQCAQRFCGHSRMPGRRVLRHQEPTRSHGMTCYTALVVTSLAYMVFLAIGAYAQYRLLEKIVGEDKETLK